MINKIFKHIPYSLLPLYDDFVKPPRDEIPVQLVQTEQDQDKHSSFTIFVSCGRGEHILHLEGDIVSEVRYLRPEGDPEL